MPCPLPHNFCTTLATPIQQHSTRRLRVCETKIMQAYACTHTPLSHSHPPALVLVWFEYLIYTLFWLSWSISFLFSDGGEKSFYSKFLTLTLEVALCVMWVSARTVVFCICFASSCVQIPQNVTSHSFLYTALRVYWFRLRLFKFFLLSLLAVSRCSYIRSFVVVLVVRVCFVWVFVLDFSLNE